MLANVNLGKDLKLLAFQGRVVVIGSRGDVTVSPRDLMTRRASIHAFTFWGVTEAEEKEIHAGIIAGLENGTLRPIVGKEMPLAEARAGHKEILEPGGFRQNRAGSVRFGKTAYSALEDPECVCLRVRDGCAS